jgi:hypothetical protein
LPPDLLTLSTQIDVLTIQRDEAQAAIVELRRTGTPARLAAVGQELRKAVQTANDAIAERDEARGAWDKLRIEVKTLRPEVADLKAQFAAKPPPAASNEAPTPKRKLPEALRNIPPVARAFLQVRFQKFRSLESQTQHFLR